MTGIRWGKLSGKNRGGTCNGGKGRKCDKSDGKDGAKCIEGGEGMKVKGLFRNRCAKSSVIDGVLIEIRSNPSVDSKNLQEQGMMMKNDACETKGNPNPSSNSLHKEGVIKKTDTCEQSFDACLNKIKSKSNLTNKKVGVSKKSGSLGKGVDEECKEKSADTVKQQGMWDNECMENVKQGTWDTECVEDVRKDKLGSECREDAEQAIWDNGYVDQGIPNSGRMLHVGLNVTPVMKEKKAHSGDEGGDAKSADGTTSVFCDKPGGANCTKVVAYDKAGDVDRIVSIQSGVSIDFDGERMKDMQHKACNAEVEKKNNSCENSVSADSELVLVPSNFVCGISKKVMEDPVVIASGQTFERACIQAWLDEGNILCPFTHEPLSHLQLIPNLTLKALISAWYSQSHDSGVESAHHSFSSCRSSFYSCPSLMSSHHQSFVSSSSFSVSKRVEETELYSSSSGSSSSLPKLLMNAELYSFSSSSGSVPSYDTPEHLRAGGIHNFPSPSSTCSPSQSWEQEREVFSLQENALQWVQSMHKLQGEDKTAVISKTSQRCSLQSKSNDLMLQSAKPCAYILSRINSLVFDLRSKYLDIQRSAAAELRLLAKDDDSYRLMIASAGALEPLVALLWSKDESIQLEATTTLLNLSLNHSLKDNIVKEGAIEALVSVLRDGFNTVAKENAAATLACLATSEENRSKIGSARAVEPLVNLLEGGTPRGRKDAAAALYRLSSNDENKRRILSAGVSRLLVDFMSNEEDKDGMVDKAIAILGNLASIEEGRVAFVEEGGILPLMQILQTASKRSKGLAVSILFQLCTHGSKHRSLVLAKDPLPTLMALSKIGNTRLKTQVAEVIQVLIVDPC